MNLSHILITGTYDNHFNTSEEGTDFCICQRSDATHVSVYLVDVEGNAEPVKDFPLGDDPARAYVDALMLASEHAVHKDSRIIDTYQKRAGQLKDLGAAQPNIHKDGEVRKQVEQEPVAWLAKTLKGSLAGRLSLAWPHNKLNPELYEGPFPVFRHADPAGVEQLRRHLHAARVALEARARTFDGLRAQLAEAQTLLREWAEMFAGGIKASPLEGLETRTLQHLSASAEPKCGKCHGRGLLRIATVCGPADKICPDCASAEPSAPACETCYDAGHVPEPMSCKGSLPCPSCAPVEIDERARFEKAVIDKAERFHPNLEQYGEHPEAEYRDPNIEWAWGLWQARAEEPKA